MPNQLYIFEKRPIARKIFVECLFERLSKKKLSMKIIGKWYPNAILPNIVALERAGYLKFHKTGVSLERKIGTYESVFKPFYEYVKKKHNVTFTERERVFLEYYFRIVLTRNMFDSQHPLEIMESKLIGFSFLKYSIRSIIESQPLIMELDVVSEEILKYFGELIENNDMDGFKNYVERTFGFIKTDEVKTKKDFYEIFLFTYMAESLPNLLDKIRGFAQPEHETLMREIEKREKEIGILKKKLNGVKKGKVASRNK